MPSGYTSKIYDGENVSGKEFIMGCARAFGALIEMRDEPANAEIPEEFKVDNFHKDRIEFSRKRLKTYQSMTLENAQFEINREHDQLLENARNDKQQKTELKNRYTNILDEVMKWQPPTPEHVNLKEFAIEQLNNSIEWDCSTTYYDHELQQKQTPNEWLETRIKDCLHEIQYHTEKYQQEVERITSRNKWVKDLRDSLK